MRDSIPRPARDAYGYFLQVPTRWMDNDLYGHVNNVVYFSYMESVPIPRTIREALERVLMPG